MTIAEAITEAGKLTGTVVDSETATRWLSEFDGKLYMEFFRQEAWDGYNNLSDQDKALLIPHPWDGLYVHHLEAMTYYTNGEYKRYGDARAMRETMLAEFKAYIMRKYGECRARFLGDDI